MSPHVLIAGAGIGGLGVALALSQIGLKVTVLEQSEVFGEVGAGVQISPNAYKVLSDWGLADALRQTANFPARLQVRNAASHALLGQLTLGESAQARYGYPFSTFHRADLHTVLLNAVRQQPNVELRLNAKIVDIMDLSFPRRRESTEALMDSHLRGNDSSEQKVQVTTVSGSRFTADALIGADGLHSRVRLHVLGDAEARSTGHTAWRALLPMADAPAELQQNQITAWLAPDSHTIAYPVQQGKSLNIVYCCENRDKNDMQPAYLLPQQLSNVLHKTLHKVLQKTFQIATKSNAWTRWDLFDRPPMSSSTEMFNPAHPHIALLGDAAHPMLPYLAQGAGMAIEDAQALAMSVQQNLSNLPSALQIYAQTRWQRNAKVQAKAARNGQIFHAKPPVSWARDAAMGLLGEKLLDVPWLYEGRSVILFIA
jgi:salicylate hydroxylase